MSDSNPIPSTSNPGSFGSITDATSAPPVITPGNPNNPPGTDLEEQTPIHGILAAAEAILRQPRRVIFRLHQQGRGGLIAALLVIALGCSLVYGIVVGTFSGGEQYWAAPLKIAAGL